MKRLIMVAAAGAALIIASQRADARVLQLSDLRTLVGVSQPQISPDGKSIAFIKSTMDFSKDDRDDQMMLLDIASGSIRNLTYDRTGLDSPRWSPTGDRLAFIADAGSGDDAQSQIFVMPMAGGDAKQVTKAPNGVQEFTWRPDGEAFAYVTADDPPDKKQIDQHFDAFDVGDLDYKTTSEAVSSHIWIVSATGAGDRRLTSGSWSISSVNGGVSFPLSWSSDGKTIAITKLPNAVYGDSDAATVALVDAKSGKVHDLPDQRPFLTGAFFAPSGDAIAALWYPHGTFNSNGYLTITSAAGGAGSVVGGQQDNVDWYAWSPDGTSIAWAAEQGAQVGVWVQPLRGTAQRLALGDVNVGGDIDIRGRAVALIGDTTDRPGELYYFATPASPIKRLTDYNGAVSKLTLGKEEEVAWTGQGGYREDGIVTLPPGYVAGRRYPLALIVHGGPQGSSQYSFDALSQLIAEHGIVTFQPNYRGSTNLGDAYQHAIYRDTGVGPGEDAMAGVAALEKMGLVDQTRMCVSGWSYGGYMTTWLESHYNVWKCAMSGAALTDWVADYTIAWYQKGDADFFGHDGSPWKNDQWDIWREQSPISWVGNVKAPTLIMADVGDANVPIYNSYLWFHALRDQGVDVQFYAYPRNTHFPGDPVGAESVERRWVDWIVSHLAP